MDEGTLSRLLVESNILLAASRGTPSGVLKAVKEKSRVENKPSVKATLAKKNGNGKKAA